MQLLKTKESLLTVLGIAVCAFFTPIDREIMLFVKNVKSSHFAPFLNVVATVNKIFYKGSILVAVFLVAYGFIKKKDIWKTLSLALILTVTLVQIKHIFGRARPSITLDNIFIGPTLSTYAYASFPSGHTTFAFMFATILSHYARRWRAIFHIFAGWIGLGRINSFSHFPSDVIGGAILGIMIAKLALFLCYKKFPVRAKKRNG